MQEAPRAVLTSGTRGSSVCPIGQTEVSIGMKYYYIGRVTEPSVLVPRTLAPSTLDAGGAVVLGLPLWANRAGSGPECITRSAPLSTPWIHSEIADATHGSKDVCVLGTRTQDILDPSK